MSTAGLNAGPSGGVSQDLLDRLNRLETELAAHVRGLPYLFARSIYGNELTLHFGTEREHTHPKLKGKVRGTHVLSVRGSGWLLGSGVRPVMIGCGFIPMPLASEERKPFNVTALESGALIGRGAKVERATPLAVEPGNAIGLRLDLDDGSWFMVVPTPPEKDGDDLPEPSDWELLTPSRVLRVGPGPDFRWESLDQPGGSGNRARPGVAP